MKQDKTPGRRPISPDGKKKEKRTVYLHPDLIAKYENEYGSLSQALQALDKQKTNQIK